MINRNEKPSEEVKQLADFFVWCASIAKIDVIDYHEAIELHGFKGKHFIPVVDKYTLAEMYFDWKAGKIKPTTKKETRHLKKGGADDKR